MPRRLTPLYQTMQRNVRQPGELIVTGAHLGALGAWAADLAYLWWGGGAKYVAKRYAVGETITEWPDEVGAADMADGSVHGPAFVHSTRGPEGAETTSMVTTLATIPEPWTVIVGLGGAGRNPETPQRNIFSNVNTVIAHHRPAAGQNRYFFHVGADNAEVHPAPLRAHWFICRRKVGEHQIESDEGEIEARTGLSRSLGGAAFLGDTGPNSSWVGLYRFVGILPLDVYDKWPGLASMRAWMNREIAQLPAFENLWTPPLLTPRSGVTVGEATCSLSAPLTDSQNIFTFDGVSLEGRTVRFRARGAPGAGPTGHWRITSTDATGEQALSPSMPISPGEYQSVQFTVPAGDTGFMFRCGTGASGNISAGDIDMGLIYVTG